MVFTSQIPCPLLDFYFLFYGLYFSSLQSSLKNINLPSLAGNGKSRLTEKVDSQYKEDDTKARFPRLQDCAHFHYEYTEFGPLCIRLTDDDDDIKTVIGRCLCPNL